MSTIIEKPWGQEEILVINDNFMVKKLTMNPGHQCSLQYHEKKREHITCLKGTLWIELPRGVIIRHVILKPGEEFYIQEKQIHQMFNRTDKPCVYLECSDPYNEDVVRLEDPYNRSAK